MLSPNPPHSGSAPQDDTPQVRRPVWSLQSELLASYVILVTLVVAGFGGCIYWLVRQATYRQAEADLLGAAELLAQDIRQGGPAIPLQISEAYRHRFGPAPRDSAYFVVWDAAGKRIAGTVPSPPHVAPPGILPPATGHKPYLSQTHGTLLDVIIRGPNGMLILIGRPLAREFDHLYALALRVSVSGLVCVVVAGVAAWWLSQRIARPLARLSSTAQNINAKNLEQRLEISGTPAELARLVDVFNTMLDRLRDAFQQQIRLTADASHELRTPVAVILSQAEQTLSKPRTTEEYTQALDTCLRSAKRMKRLVDDLLILARADAGRLQLQRQDVDLAEIARQSISLLQPLAIEREVRVGMQLQTTLVNGDYSRLSQVFTNLITNALQYNHPGGDVFVSVLTRGVTAQLIVADTGSGIDAGDLPHLFERFYRADRSRGHTAGQGTGLGLSIVAEIVAAHHGRIDIASQPGAGTTVTVELPLYPHGTENPDSSSTQD